MILLRSRLLIPRPTHFVQLGELFKECINVRRDNAITAQCDSTQFGGVVVLGDRSVGGDVAVDRAVLITVLNGRCTQPIAENLAVHCMSGRAS